MEEVVLLIGVYGALGWILFMTQRNKTKKLQLMINNLHIDLLELRDKHRRIKDANSGTQ